MAGDGAGSPVRGLASGLRRPGAMVPGRSPAWRPAPTPTGAPPVDVHRPVHCCRERLRGLRRQRPDGEIPQTADVGLVLPPPHVRPPPAVDVEHDRVRLAAGLAQFLHVWKTDQDPEQDAPGEVSLRQRGLVVGTEPAPEGKRLVRVPREREDADHHPFLCLGRMPRHRERKRAVHLPVEVGDLQADLVNRGVECHRPMVTADPLARKPRRARLPRVGPLQSGPQRPGSSVDRATPS